MWKPVSPDRVTPRRVQRDPRWARDPPMQDFSLPRLLGWLVLKPERGGPA